MPSRIVHVVRITDPNEPQQYVDVEVADGVSFVLPDYKEKLLTVPPSASTSSVVDKTGDGSSSVVANPTRITHWERLTNPDDNTQYLDVEILDGVSFQRANGDQLTLSMQSENAVTAIKDNTGLGLGTTPSNATRVAHIEKVVSPDDKTQYTAVAAMDGITFKKPNYDEFTLSMADQDPIDTTSYDSDGNPPNNTDPNKYVRFVGGGPWLGSKPLSAQTGNNGPVNQGLLWRIKSAKSFTGDVAIFVLDLDLGYFGQSTGDLNFYISSSNFPLWEGGTVIHYSAVDTNPPNAFPDTQAASAVYPHPGKPEPPPIPNSTDMHGFLDSYFKNYAAWRLKASPFDPPSFGGGAVNIFCLNLKQIREQLGKGKDITFTMTTSGYPNITRILAFQYSFLSISMSATVMEAQHLTDIVRVTREQDAFFSAAGIYEIFVQPTYQFFGPKNAFFAGSGLWPNFVPYLETGLAFSFTIQALYNYLTNTGNVFTDDAPTINYTIKPDNSMEADVTFGSNENNFQLFVF